jgi:hypothetical protein
LSRYFLIHVSDTHYAAAGEDLGYGIAKSAAAGFSSAATTKANVIKNHGARAANSRLWDELLRAVEDITTDLSARSESFSVLHAGDVTQAGQLGSMSYALRELKTRAQGRELFVVPGNHDLWPSDFPAVAPSRTGVQFLKIRDVPEMPAKYPDGPHQLGGMLECFLLNSAIPDSMLNSFAWGKVEPESGQSASPSTLGPLARPRATRLRSVLIHHPITVPPAPASTANPTSRTSAPPVAGTLLDGPALLQQLVGHEVALVFCGHEHALSNPHARLYCGDRLLQLSAGCPTLWQGYGNHDEPQLSLYQLEQDDCGVTLSWLVCGLSPRRWIAQPSYCHDGTRWLACGPSKLPLGGPPGGHSLPPFP